MEIPLHKRFYVCSAAGLVAALCGISCRRWRCSCIRPGRNRVLHGVRHDTRFLGVVYFLVFTPSAWRCGFSADPMQRRRRPIAPSGARSSTEPTRLLRKAVLDGKTFLVAEFWDYLMHNKKWWMIPIIVMILLLAVVLILGSTPAAPLIYPLF